MTMQGVTSAAVPAAPVISVKRRALAHIPGDDGWALVGRTLNILADPKGEVEMMSAQYGLAYRSPVFGETSSTVLGPEANGLLRCALTTRFWSTHAAGS